MTDYWPEAIETTLGFVSPKYLAYKLESPLDSDGTPLVSCKGQKLRTKTGLRIEVEPDSEYLEIEFLADQIVFYRWGAGITPTYQSYSLFQPDAIDKVIDWLQEHNIELVQEKVQEICPNFQVPTAKTSGRQ
jgi:hypothetical protein